MVVHHVALNEQISGLNEQMIEGIVQGTMHVQLVLTFTGSSQYRVYQSVSQYYASVLLVEESEPGQC